VHPDDRVDSDPALSDYMAGRSAAYHAERRYVRKDGQIVWAEVTAALIRDADGKPLRSAAVINDISERKQAEKARRVL
jgi:PAS domain S-box-containing protein